MVFHFLRTASGFLSTTNDQDAVTASPETVAVPVVENDGYVMPFDRIDQTLRHPERRSDPRVPHIGLQLIATVEAWDDVTAQRIEAAYDTPADQPSLHLVKPAYDTSADQSSLPLAA